MTSSQLDVLAAVILYATGKATKEEAARHAKDLVASIEEAFQRI
jgi:hypothetical protein